MNLIGENPMSQFVKTPNLPNSPVLLAAAGEDYAKEIGAALLPFGIKLLACPNNPLVDERLRSHIDLSVFHAGGNRFLVSDAIAVSGFSEELIKLGAEIIVSDSKLSTEYPFDAALCALSNGDTLFHNLKYTDKLLLDSCKLKKIHVNQGYAKCAALLISQKAVITADRGISKAMRSEGFDVLEIGAHGIDLKGFDDGLIGGAGFKISGDKLAFTGVLTNHPDKSAMENFLKFHEITPIFLTDKPIFDVGSILQIIEQK